VNIRRSLISWIAIVRLLAVPVAVLQVAISRGAPSHHELYAWIATGVLLAGGLILFRLARTHPTTGVAIAGLVFDFAVASSYALLYAWQPGTPLRQVFDLVVIEGAALFGARGGAVVALATAPVLAWFERLRSEHFQGNYRVEYVTFQVATELLIALLLGWIVRRLAEQSADAESRAAEAEALRDELGRRSMRQTVAPVR
jgi:hypothetical protein